jgi:hypothetical protein
MQLFDQEEMIRINTFDWEDEFAEIMRRWWIRCGDWESAVCEARKFDGTEGIFTALRSIKLIRPVLICITYFMEKSH